MAKKLTGQDIVNTVNIDIHSPVLPNWETVQALSAKIKESIGKCHVRFHTERGNTFEISAYNGDLQEKEELQKQVMTLFFNFLYKN